VRHWEVANDDTSCQGEKKLAGIIRRRTLVFAHLSTRFTFDSTHFTEVLSKAVAQVLSAPQASPRSAAWTCITMETSPKRSVDMGEVKEFMVKK